MQFIIDLATLRTSITLIISRGPINVGVYSILAEDVANETEQDSIPFLETTCDSIRCTQPPDDNPVI